MAVGVLLPVLLAAAAFVSVTWVWAAASTLSIASTPAVSQAGLALWMALQVYLFTGGGDLVQSELAAGCRVPTGHRSALTAVLTGRVVEMCACMLRVHCTEATSDTKGQHHKLAAGLCA
jgi:hypothetical protein